jgi:hypothetical protein
LEKSQFKIGLKTVRIGLWGTYGESKGANRILVRKPEGKRPLGKPRSRGEGNTKSMFNK